MKKFVPKEGLVVPHPAGGVVSAEGVLVADADVSYFLRRVADGDGVLVDVAEAAGTVVVTEKKGDAK